MNGKFNFKSVSGQGRGVWGELGRGAGGGRQIGQGGPGKGAKGAVEEREWGVRQRATGVLVIVKIWTAELRRLTFDFTNNLFELVISCPLCIHWQWLMLFIM